MEAGHIIRTIVMEASAVLVLAGMVAFAVWVSRTERRAFEHHVQNPGDLLQP